MSDIQKAPLPSKTRVEEALDLVHKVFPGTPQYAWPLLAERTGTEVWVKHENHTPIGAFKVRGGLVFMDDLTRHGASGGLITATRGNHGQSVALAARRYGLNATIVVPHGNSVEKNAAMRAFGANLIEHGEDFQESLEFCQDKAAADHLTMVPSFHPLLVAGVATYAMEFFRQAGELDTVYVPIGLGSGISGVLTAREALGYKTEVVGVNAENAAAYALSFAQGQMVTTNSVNTMADGVACRVPNAEALEIILSHADRVITVSEAEIKEAMRIYFTDTHQVAEGAGAAALAALMQERSTQQGKRVGVILSGGNIDRPLFQSVLAEAGPCPGCPKALSDA
ncbi:MAG: threonine dehydratase [Alphaproteobacteria bacterium]|nr:threonine dehydratase [Alphaproteobacteria bacterium]